MRSSLASCASCSVVVLALEHRARVHHRLVEEQREQVVAQVVVRGDVAAAAVDAVAVEPVQHAPQRVGERTPRRLRTTPSRRDWRRTCAPAPSGRRCARGRGCRLRRRRPCRRTRRPRRSAGAGSRASRAGRSPGVRRPNTCRSPVAGTTTVSSPCSNLDERLQEQALAEPLQPRARRVAVVRQRHGIDRRDDDAWRPCFGVVLLMAWSRWARRVRHGDDARRRSCRDGWKGHALQPEPQGLPVDRRGRP